MKPLSEFEQLCIAFVRAAKGDFIDGPPEPSGTNQGSSSIYDATTSGVTTSNKTTTTTEMPSTSKKLIPGELIFPKKDKKKNQDVCDLNDCKKSFFSTVQMIEEERHQWELKKTRLKCYNLVLRNMCLEKELALESNVISNVRNTISPELINFPIYATETLNVSNEEVLNEND